VAGQSSASVKIFAWQLQQQQQQQQWQKPAFVVFRHRVILRLTASSLTSRSKFRFSPAHECVILKIKLPVTSVHKQRNSLLKTGFFFF
jgi:ABC-type cobalamin transport system permease subunit